MTLQQPHNKPQPPEWISVYITHNLQEAHIVAGRLQAHDIPTMVHTVPGASALGITIGNLGEINILIHPDDYDVAADILYEDDRTQLEANTDAIQYIWHDDGDGVEYYIEEDEDEDE